jgi:LuxR family transcriptional regulator
MARPEDIEAEVAKLSPLAPAGYFLAVRLKGASPLMTFSTFPEAWTDEYMEKGYMMRDPVTTWALTLGGAIRWSSHFLPDPFGVFKAAARHGLRFGASVATGPVSSLTLGSFARADRDLTDDEIATAKATVGRIHAMTEPPRAVAEWDAEVLRAAEAGKGVKAGAERVAALCEAFSVRTIDEAARRAKALKLI